VIIAGFLVRITNSIYNKRTPRSVGSIK